MSRFIGNVSAYAYAVSKGYTGTEEEFAELMASYADVGQTAVDAAESALNSKTAAQTAATTATNKASEATTAAQTATTKAGEAQTSAQTASTKASEAVGCVETATQKATESAQSASQALGYKNDAESAKTASQTAQGLAESARDSAISAKNDAESARDEAQNIVDGISAKASQIDANTASIASLTKDKAPVITDTASGAIASFTDGADNLPLKSLVIDINPVQDLSQGDPSPENICPISGWTEVDVEQRGKNLFDKSVVEVGALKADGTVQVTGSTKYVSGYIRISPNTSYYLSNVIPATDGRSGFWYDADKNPIEAIIQSPYTLTSFAVVSPSNAEYVRIGCYIASADICQLEAGSTATPYEPYTGRSININLGQTVYGGKLDVVSGVLTVDRAMIASYNGETLPSTWISDRDAYAQGATPTTGAQVVYKLATPTTVQLTPHEVATLLGVNNIFADCGDVTAEYRADTKLFIERLTAPDSADMVADANITSGQYFMVGNSLFKATANIANGAQIIVGTNAVRKSLSEALNEINA